MTTISLQDAQAGLAELIRGLSAGEEIVITDNDLPIAKLSATSHPKRKARVPGSMRGSVLYIAPDFDAPLEDFKEYME